MRPLTSVQSTMLRILRPALGLALVTAFLGGAWADAAAIHPCAHHLGALAGTAEAGHTDHGSSNGANPEERSGHGDHGAPCTCLGDCGGGAEAFQSPPAASPVAVPLAVRRAARLGNPSVWSPMVPDHFTPLATAPPRMG